MTYSPNFTAYSPQEYLTLRLRSFLPLTAAAAFAVASAAPSLADAPTGQTVDGIRCDQSEGAVFHIHQHVAIFDRGKPVTIPDDVGRPIVGNCLYWLHTHTPDGIIHVESPVFRTFTLGNFFDVWGQPLRATNVAGAKGSKGALHVYLDGDRYTGDPRKIQLSAHADITLEVGAPYHKPAPFTDWRGQ
ncbi:MAG: hypothetical protein ABI346_00200 [Candidatus Baltobacteraceae bacterium]